MTGGKMLELKVKTDANGIVALRFGVTPAGRRLSYWIRNVRLLK